MKTIIATIALTISSLISFAQDITDASITENQTVEAIAETEGTSITVNVPVMSNDGSIFFSLQTKKNFLKGGVDNLESKIVDGKATVTFINVAPGEYAITLFWDKNGNKQMDFEANGMPKEMYGVSNNVMNFGPPQWSDAVFTVTNEAQTLDIRM